MSRAVNLFATQGEDLNFSITLTDLNGEPYNTHLIANAAGSARKSYISANSADFAVNVDSGTLTLTLTSIQTANLAPGRYIYDVKFTDVANVVSKPISGILLIAPGATR